MSGSKARVEFLLVLRTMKNKSSSSKKHRNEIPVEEVKSISAATAAKEVGQEVGVKGPSPHEQLTIQAIRALRIWQQVTVDQANRATALDVAKLALELARLRGGNDPQKFLDEAARLLSEARFAVGREQARPEREQREQIEKMTEGLVDELQGGQVPFARLCRPAQDAEKIGASDLPANEAFSFKNEDGKEISFQWRVYRDERDFKEVLAKHAKHIYQQVGEELTLLEGSAQIHNQWGDAAVKLLTCRHWLPDEWEQKFLKVTNAADGATILSQYLLAATEAVEQNLWRMAEAGKLDVVTLYAVYNTRQGTYKTRGRNQPKS